MLSNLCRLGIWLSSFKNGALTWICTTSFRRQLLRSGTSVGANYRAAHRAKSKADFISKLGTVLEEADESGYWIELLADVGKIDSNKSAALHEEAIELVAITVSSINTARRNSDLQV
jgi:four helix bundle protein